jgi:hypothetical protein
MISLLQTVTTLAKVLTDGQLFTSQSGSLLEIVYHQQVMPARGRDTVGENMPFCLVKPRVFSLFPSRSQQIELVYALHNEDRDEAMTDMGRLTTLLEPLATDRGKYDGWKLEAITGYPGDNDTGVQPHPEYYLTVVIELANLTIKQKF